MIPCSEVLDSRDVTPATHAGKGLETRSGIAFVRAPLITRSGVSQPISLSRIPQAYDLVRRAPGGTFASFMMGVRSGGGFQTSRNRSVCTSVQIPHNYGPNRPSADPHLVG